MYILITLYVFKSIIDLFPLSIVFQGFLFRKLLFFHNILVWHRCYLVFIETGSELDHALDSGHEPFLLSVHVLLREDSGEEVSLCPIGCDLRLLVLLASQEP